LTWLIRYGHVLGGALWLGGYVVLALVIVPMFAKGTNETVQRLAITTVRVLTYAGTATIFFGIILITRTRGMDTLFAGEWGALVLASAVIALLLLGMGDGALRPALARLHETGDAMRARRLALFGLALTILAIGLMTRAVYAPS
jgi:putative copper export protein